MASGHPDLPAPRTELDSHANMAVVGGNCVVFDGIHGKACNALQATFHFARLIWLGQLAS